MIEVLFIELQNSLYFDVGVYVNLPLVGKRDFNIRDKTDSDSHCPLGNNFAQLSSLLVGLQIVRRSSNHRRQRSLELYDFVLKNSVTNLVACDFSELIHRRDVLLFNVKLDLNVASISRK